MLNRMFNTHSFSQQPTSGATHVFQNSFEMHAMSTVTVSRTLNHTGVQLRNMGLSTAHWNPTQHPLAGTVCHCRCPTVSYSYLTTLDLQKIGEIGEQRSEGQGTFAAKQMLELPHHLL